MRHQVRGSWVSSVNFCATSANGDFEKSESVKLPVDLMEGPRVWERSEGGGVRESRGEVCERGTTRERVPCIGGGSESETG